MSSHALWFALVARSACNFALLSAAMRAVFSFLTFFFPLSDDYAASFRLALTTQSWSLAFFVSTLAKVVAALDLARFPSMVSRLAFSLAIWRSHAWTIRAVFQLAGRLVSSGGSTVKISTQERGGTSTKVADTTTAGISTSTAASAAERSRA